MNAWTTLIQAETLAEILPGEDLRVLDCRFALNDKSAGEAAWRSAHIPGAQYAHLDRDLSALHASRAHTPGSGRHPWPEASDFADWLARCCVGAEHQVIAYDAGDGAYAARLWFLLRAFGHDKVAVLDGGWARWSSLGLPTTDEAPATQRLDVRDRAGVSNFDRSRLVDVSEVRARLRAGDLLIDARAAERFRGETEPLDRVAGHVPGAVNRPYAGNLQDGRFKSPEQLAEEFRALLGDHAPERTIAMCGSGVTACHHLLAMAYAGLEGAALFTGSWSGWIEDSERPVAVGAV